MKKKEFEFDYEGKNTPEQDVFDMKHKGETVGRIIIQKDDGSISMDIIPIPRNGTGKEIRIYTHGKGLGRAEF